jgi:uncharacterized protein (TIGR02996 family)
MIEDEGLYRAILDDPDSDMPRLIYADWLEEQGDADRAEFIRVQCELAGPPPILPDKSSLRARAQLCAHVRSLLARHELEWLGPFLPSVRAGKLWVEFRRGFVGYALFHPGRDHPGLYRESSLWTIWGAAWGRYRRARPTLLLDEIEDLFSLAPIQDLMISANSPALPTLMAVPGLARLRRLQLDFPIRGSGNLADALRRARQGRDISRLGHEGARLVSSSPAWAGLRELVMRHGVVDVGLIALLATSGHRAQLAVLDLTGNPIGDQGAEAMAGATGLAGLERLILSFCGIGDAGARALLESIAFPGLRMLDLSDNPIGDLMRSALRERFGAAVRL